MYLQFKSIQLHNNNQFIHPNYGARHWCTLVQMKGTPVVASTLDLMVLAAKSCAKGALALALGESKVAMEILEL